MSAILFIEGGASGANSKELTIRCQKAFHRLLERMDLGLEGRKPKLRACGGRDRVFRDFRTEMQVGDHDYIAMWIAQRVRGQSGNRETTTRKPNLKERLTGPPPMRTAQRTSPGTSTNAPPRNTRPERDSRSSLPSFAT